MSAHTEVHIPDFQVVLSVKNLLANARDQGLIPGLGRSLGEGKVYPLQYSGLENSMDCIGHRVAESDTTERLSLSLQRIQIEEILCPMPIKRNWSHLPHQD